MNSLESLNLSIVLRYLCGENHECADARDASNSYGPRGSISSITAAST